MNVDTTNLSEREREVYNAIHNERHYNGIAFDDVIRSVYGVDMSSDAVFDCVTALVSRGMIVVVKDESGKAEDFTACCFLSTLRAGMYYDVKADENGMMQVAKTSHDATVFRYVLAHAIQGLREAYDYSDAELSNTIGTALINGLAEVESSAREERRWLDSERLSSLLVAAQAMFPLPD